MDALDQRLAESGQERYDPGKAWLYKLFQFRLDLARLQTQFLVF